MKFDTLKKLLLYLAVGFALLMLWNDPSGAARSATGFIGDIGDFSASVIDKVSRFVIELFD